MLPKNANGWHQGELSFTTFAQYAFQTEQVGITFPLSFESKIRLRLCCSASATSCLQVRVCTVYSALYFSSHFCCSQLTLRHNSLGQNTDYVSADFTAMQLYEFLNLCLVEVPNVTHSGHLLIARITCMFPCLCAQGSSVAEYQTTADSL